MEALANWMSQYLSTEDIYIIAVIILAGVLLRIGFKWMEGDYDE